MCTFTFVFGERTTPHTLQMEFFFRLPDDSDPAGGGMTRMLPSPSLLLLLMSVGVGAGGVGAAAAVGEGKGLMTAGSNGLESGAEGNPTTIA